MEVFPLVKAWVLLVQSTLLNVLLLTEAMWVLVEFNSPFSIASDMLYDFK